MKLHARRTFVFHRYKWQTLSLETSEQTALACPSNSTPKMALTHTIQTNCQLHWRFTNRKRTNPFASMFVSRSHSLTHPNNLRVKFNHLAADKPINTQTWPFRLGTSAVILMTMNASAVAIKINREQETKTDEHNKSSSISSMRSTPKSKSARKFWKQQRFEIFEWRRLQTVAAGMLATELPLLSEKL